VAVLDFASLYPSCFIANNICWSTLLPPKKHDEANPPIPHHVTPDTVAPNSRVAGVSAPFDMFPWETGTDNEVRRWHGSGIAFVEQSTHAGLMPRLLQRLLTERRQVKARIKELHNTRAADDDDDDAKAIEDVAAVLDARQLTLKLLANASYGFCGADTSHLCCKPLAEACLRFGNHYARAAARLIEAEGMGHTPSTESTTARWPGAHAIYANTDSVFVKLPGRTAAQAVKEGRQMAEFVSTHAQMPHALTLEFERVLSPCLLDGHNRYAGAEFVTGEEPTPRLHQKGLLERTQCAFIQQTILQAMRVCMLSELSILDPRVVFSPWALLPLLGYPLGETRHRSAHRRVDGSGLGLWAAVS